MEDPILTFPTRPIEQEVLTDITRGDILPGPEPDEELSKRYMKMVSPFVLNEPIEGKPSPYSRTDYWVPAREDKIVEMPSSLWDNYKRVYPLMQNEKHYNGMITVVTDSQTKMEFFEPPLEETTDDLPHENDQDNAVDRQELKPPLYHLIVTFEDDEVLEKRVLSLQRSHRVTDLVPLCEKCHECEDLFRIIPKGMTQAEYLAGLLLMLKNHSLWHSGHIAAAMGVVEYFRPETEDSARSLTIACLPEEMNPLEIATQYNQKELASILGASFIGTEKEVPSLEKAAVPVTSPSNGSLTNSQL